jgi:hypothetical protein
MNDGPDVPAGYTTGGALHVEYLDWDQVHGFASPPYPKRFVCTNDGAEAKSWFSTLHPSYADIGGVAETEKYFEISSTDGQALARVDKCSYLDRSGMDVDAAGALGNSQRGVSIVIGTLAVRPVTSSAASDAAQYLYAQQFMDGDKKVLSVTSSDAGETFVMDFEVIESLGVDVPDVENAHDSISIDKTTGTMSVTFGEPQGNLCK